MFALLHGDFALFALSSLHFMPQKYTIFVNSIFYVPILTLFILREQLSLQHGRWGTPLLSS